MSILQREFSSPVVGFWRLLDWKWEIDQIYRFSRQCTELGITTFDHADIYGDYAIEARFGEMLVRNPGFRRTIQIITKCGIKLKSPKFPDRKVGYYDTTRAHIVASVEQSLRNFHTDYIDLLLIHRPDPLMDADETAAVLSDLVQSGKVRFIGVSNFTPYQFSLLQSRLDIPLITNQIEFSLLHWEPLEDGSLDHAQETGISPMAWSPLGGGALFRLDNGTIQPLQAKLKELGSWYGGLEIDQVALMWILKHPSRITPVLGTGNIDRVRSAMAIMSKTMEREHWFELLKAARGYDVP